MRLYRFSGALPRTPSTFLKESCIKNLLLFLYAGSFIFCKKKQEKTKRKNKFIKKNDCPILKFLFNSIGLRLAAAVCEKRLRICNRYNIAKTYLATKIASRHKRREIPPVLPCRTDKEHKTGVFQKQVSHICRSAKKRGSLIDFRVYRFLQVSFKIFGACLNEIVDFFR